MTKLQPTTNESLKSEREVLREQHLTQPPIDRILQKLSCMELPAAGIFDSWPNFARLIRLLDPCMGSGHFLVFALPLLVRLRMEEEKLSAQAAVVAVLKDNIHGLELDERCTQIAAFNVALTA